MVWGGGGGILRPSFSEENKEPGENRVKQNRRVRCKCFYMFAESTEYFLVFAES